MRCDWSWSGYPNLIAICSTRRERSGLSNCSTNCHFEWGTVGECLLESLLVNTFHFILLQGVQSKKGQGAIFWVELSYRRATQAEIDSTKNMSPIPTLINAFPHSLTRLPSSPGPSRLPSFGSSVTAIDGPDPHTTSPLTLADARHLQLRPPLLRDPSSEARSLIQPSIATVDSGGSTQSVIYSPADDPITVLVVDDDPLTRTLMSRLVILLRIVSDGLHLPGRRMLTKLGCVVETADDGRKCLDILLGATTEDNPRHFDMISLDNAMPVTGARLPSRNLPANIVNASAQVVTGESAICHLRSVGRTDLVIGKFQLQ